MLQAMSFLSLIFALVGMTGNAMVLWLLGFHMDRNAFSVYILNLAVVDFLFLCSQFVYCLLCIIYIFYSIYSHIHLFSLVVSTFAYLSGLSMLSALSIEVCLSVMWPIWYHCHRPRRTSAVTCALLWTLSLLLSLLYGKACGLLFNDFKIFSCSKIDLIVASWTIISFVVRCGSSLTLLVRIFCGSQRVPVTRLYVIIVLTVVFFLIFGLPLGIYWLFFQWISIYYDKLCYFYSVTIFLSCINSCANPIIYFFVGFIRHNKLQRKSLKLFLQRALQDTPEEEEGGELDSSGEHRELGTL